MPTTRSTFALLLPLTLAIGCGTSAVRHEAPTATTDAARDAAVSYTVQRGDRLGDIALEFTGDIEHWKAIAASNGIEDPRDLRAGAVLRIPADLVTGRTDRLATNDAADDPTRDAARRRGAAREVVPDAMPDAGTGAAPALGARRAPPVEISPVDVNRDFELSPLEAPTAAPRADDDGSASLEIDGRSPGVRSPRKVKVVGSYFPRGLYAQPAVYSRLLMRVDPGTLFLLEREVGDWYGVVTDGGTVGYLRDSDARVIDADAVRSTASLGDTRG